MLNTHAFNISFILFSTTGLAITASRSFSTMPIGISGLYDSFLLFRRTTISSMVFLITELQSTTDSFVKIAYSVLSIFTRVLGL